MKPIVFKKQKKSMGITKAYGRINSNYQQHDQ